MILSVLLHFTVKVMRRTFRGIVLVDRVIHVKDERCNDVYCHDDLKVCDIVIKREEVKGYYERGKRNFRSRRCGRFR